MFSGADLEIIRHSWWIKTFTNINFQHVSLAIFLPWNLLIRYWCSHSSFLLTGVYVRIFPHSFLQAVLFSHISIWLIETAYGFLKILPDDLWLLIEALSSRHNKAPQTARLEQQKSMFSQFWQLEVWDQGSSRSGSWWELSSYRVDGCLPTMSSQRLSSVCARGERASELSLPLLMRPLTLWD